MWKDHSPHESGRNRSLCQSGSELHINIWQIRCAGSWSTGRCHCHNYFPLCRVRHCAHPHAPSCTGSSLCPGTLRHIKSACFPYDKNYYQGYAASFKRNALGCRNGYADAVLFYPGIKRDSRTQYFKYD